MYAVILAGDNFQLRGQTKISRVFIIVFLREMTFRPNSVHLWYTFL